MFNNAMLLLLTQILLMTVMAEEFNGRHVCKHQQIVAEPIPVKQSYIRAVHRKDLQRVVYQTAYKTVFKMQIHYTNVSGCCPGWEKRSPRDANCMQPVCEEGCENEGQCVGPGLCVCSEGYTGYRCHIDIDECTGRNSCQQKCTNMPGSYECSCQDGFQLAQDEYTCDLCVSCTKEFKELYAQVEKLQSDNRQDIVVDEIREIVDNFTLDTTDTDMIQDIQRELANLSESVIKKNIFEHLQKEVDILKDSITNVDIIEDLSERIDVLEESSHHAEMFREINNKIDDLATVEVVAEIAQTLNDTIQRLRDSDSQTKQLNEMQKLIEDLAIGKAQQDEAQADKFQEMNKELNLLREENVLSATVQEIKDRLEQVSGQVQDLESHQQYFQNETTLQSERLQDLQKEVDTLTEIVQNDDDMFKEINFRIDNLEESSLHTNKFQEIHNKMIDLATVKDIAEVAQSLNDTIHSLQQDDNQTKQFNEMKKQIEQLEIENAQQEEAQADMFEEMHNQLEQLKEVRALSKTVQEMKALMEEMAVRVRELESEKAALKTNLTEVVAHYEAAISAFHAKDVNLEHVTTDPDDLHQGVPLDRLVSLSEQISILEERMADCQCNQDYSRG